MLCAVRQQRGVCQHLCASPANRLGIGQLKWEIEGALSATNNQIHTSRLLNSCLGGILCANNTSPTLLTISRQKWTVQTSVTIGGRLKHHSIWRKNAEKGLGLMSFLTCVRCVLSPTSCKTVMPAGVVHTKYKHHSEFDDYVANLSRMVISRFIPRFLAHKARPFEIQIRTKQMHEDSGSGVTAHWKYKERCI